MKRLVGIAAMVCTLALFSFPSFAATFSPHDWELPDWTDDGIQVSQTLA